MKSLKKVMPNDWINIPAPVRDAILIMRDNVGGILHRIETTTKELRALDDRLAKKEKRQKDSIEDIMTFIKDKMNLQNAKTVGSLDNINAVVDSNFEILKAKVESLDAEQNLKIAGVYESVRENYWSSERSKEYVDKLVEQESNSAKISLTSVFKS